MVSLWSFSPRPGASPSQNASSDPPVPSATSSATAPSPPPASKEPPVSPSLGDEELIRRFLTPDPERTGYDPALPWWHNYMRRLQGRITSEGVEQFREDQYRIHEARDLAKAEEWRDWLLEYSPIVRFLRDRVADLGGELDRSNIICRRCPGRPVVVRERDPATGLETAEPTVAMARQAGGFSPGHGIVVCSNAIRDRGHLEDVLAHEMVHAWDHLRWQVNFVGQVDLKHAACTEIRASMLSGECRWSREFFDRGNWSLSQEFQRCVRRRAVQSVMARPSCKDDAHAVRVVNQVWDSCYADKRPFNDVFK